MSNIDRGFQIDVLSVGETTLVTSGNDNPSSVGYEAPIGSLYLSTNGSTYLKNTGVDTGWKPIMYSDFTNVSGVLSVTSGGTGLNTITTGQIIFGSGTNTYGRLNAGTSGFVLTSAGVAAPTWSKVAISSLADITQLSVLGRSVGSNGPVAPINAGTDDVVLRRSSSVLGFGSINLGATNTVGSSVLAIANGGTGQTSANNAFNALAPSQTGNAGRYLTTNGTTTSWGVITTGGTVNSVDLSGGTTGLTSSGGPITTSGTLTLSGTLVAVNGGTGQSTYAVGDILFSNVTNNLTKLSGNITTTKQYLSQTGTGSASAAPVWSIITKAEVGLGNVENTALSTWNGSTNITTVGTISSGNWNATPIAIANGGTGQTTANSALNALLPLQTGNSGRVLSSNGTNASWVVPNAGTVTSVSVSGGTTGLTTSGGPITSTGTISLAGTLSIANGGTGQTSANNAFNALAPSQVSNGGRFLTTNGTTTSWSPNIPIASLGDITQLSVLGRSVGSNGPVAPINAGTDDVVFRRSSSVLGFGSINLGATNTVGSSVLLPANGGTGLSSIGSSNRVLGVNNLGTLLEYKTITPGTGITVQHNPTEIVISADSGNGNPALSVNATTGNWVLGSNGYYYQDITHNLNTTNISVVAYRLDTTPNELVLLNNVLIQNSNTIRIESFGIPTFNIKLVIFSGGDVYNNITVSNNGASPTGTGSLNFKGFLLINNAGTIEIENPIPLRTYTYYATSLDSPNNSNWAVNQLAPVVSDPTNQAFGVRRFSNTGEQGVGLSLTIPNTATNVRFKVKGRPQVAPVSTANVQLNLYTKRIPNNAAVGSWSTANNLNIMSIPTNVNFQYYEVAYALSALSLQAGNLYQFEFTRRNAVASNYTNNWFLYELSVEFF
jgi:hypothetical protein